MPSMTPASKHQRFLVLLSFCIFFGSQGFLLPAVTTKNAGTEKYAVDGNVDERQVEPVVDSLPGSIRSPKSKEKRIFGCDLEGSQKGGQGCWHHDLSVSVAQQIVQDACLTRTVDRETLLDAIDLLDFEATYNGGASLTPSLHGSWSVVFSYGPSFVTFDTPKDRWGYLLEHASIKIGVNLLDNSMEVDYAGSKAFYGHLAVDGSPDIRVQFNHVVGKKQEAPLTYTPSIEKMLSSSVILSIISLDDNALVARYTPEGQESSLLVFNKATPIETVRFMPRPPPLATVAVGATPSTKQGRTGPPSNLKKNRKPSKPLKAREPDHLSGGYPSIFHYLEEELVPLYLAISLPTMMKLAPVILHEASYRSNLFHELLMKGISMFLSS